jgi:hypothetical protein
MKRRDAAAGKPAVTLPGIMTEQDRAIAARREAGETRKAICDALGVTVGVVQTAEWRSRNDARVRKMLAERPDSIEGLSILGTLDRKAADQLRFHHYRHEGPILEGLSEVAALGRLYVSRIHGIGPKSLASIDHVLGLFGIAWSPVNRLPLPRRPRPEPEQSSSTTWDDIAERVARIERVIGHFVLEKDPDRDTAVGILCRLSFLTGYLEETAKSKARGQTIDGECQRDNSEDLETAGNLVCLPGVKLIDVLPQHDGGAS